MLLIFSPSCLSLWRRIGGRKAFQSPFFSMIALALVHRSFQVAKLNSSLVRSNLSCCGFEIYRAKSNWDPTRRFSWIGYNIDTCTGLIFASDARIEKLCSGLNDICPSLEFFACVHVKNVASIVGQIISMTRQLWECYPDYDQIFASYYQFSGFVEFPWLRARSSKARVLFL